MSQTVVPGGSADASAPPWDGVPHLARLPSQRLREHLSLYHVSCFLAMLKQVSEVSSILGRASTVGLGKAVDVLDTLGSSMTNLNISGFGSGTTTKGNKISILAFEVANTIVKGCSLMRALSKDSIKHLKETVLHSEGVQNLISKDMDELLKISSADKREELKVFSTEVVRFGNRCKDPQWHQLDRYFDKLASERTPQHHLKEEAESLMQQLLTCVQFTAELYHEMHALDRFEQDYQRKHQEEDGSGVVQRGNGKNLWTLCTFYIWRSIMPLGVQLTASQIKAEMEKTLRWLVPIANNTTK
ncbi:hypothetical protein HU200_026273 [Digitaria exilis]|uniref:DUF3475 domain-containing protein n=1 Tax=Digitaria exilis TaxID=1010633 RepID=A0A835C3N3_9POAL|nr:hypothetical protein HU200_026273 [Digitaria exilis]